MRGPRETFNLRHDPPPTTDRVVALEGLRTSGVGNGDTGRPHLA